jgi:hypothetical protein
MSRPGWVACSHDLGRENGYEGNERRDVCAKGGLMCIAVVLCERVRLLKRMYKRDPRSKARDFAAN